MKAQSSNVKAQSSKFKYYLSFGFCHLDFTWLKTFVIWILIFFLFILSGCGSLPRIVILKDPLSAEEHIVLGVSYETKGLLDQAILEYKAALDKDGSNSNAKVNLGNVYYKKGDLDTAQGYYLEALKIDRDNPYAGNNLAWIYVEKDIRLAEAEGLAARAVEKDPKNRAYYLETLALVYYKMGRYDDALKRLDEAELSANSGDEQLRKTLAEDREKILGSNKQREEGRRQ